MGRTVRAVVLALVMSIGAVSVLPMSASAERPEIQASYVPHTDMSVDFGWVTATMYFNRTETRLIASGAYGVATICALVGGWGGVAALACMLGWPRIVNGAQTAYAAGVCVGLRFYIGNPAVNWTVRHSGGRC